MYRQSVIGNPDVHWETAIKNNLGFELGLFKNLITLNVDVYNEDRTGYYYREVKGIFLLFSVQPLRAPTLAR